MALPATARIAAQTPAAVKTPTIVDVGNFVRAESDLYFGRYVKRGAFGKFVHERTMTPIDKQEIVRMNRDTLYSFAVIDLDAAPVTVTLPAPRILPASGRPTSCRYDQRRTAALGSFEVPAWDATSQNKMALLSKR